MKIDSTDLIQKWLHAFPNGWIQNCYEHGLHTIRCSHDMIPMSEPEANKNILAIVFWRDGTIIKDESGLFIKVSPTVHKQYFGGNGGSGGKAPIFAHIGGSGKIEVTEVYTDGKWVPVGKYDKGCMNKLKKCECGASSVGSNVHSGWCALNG